MLRHHLQLVITLGLLLDSFTAAVPSNGEKFLTIGNCTSQETLAIVQNVNSKCIDRSIFNVDNLAIIAITSSSSDVITGYCSNIKKMLECFDTTIAQMPPCMGKSLKGTIHRYILAVEGGIEYICGNNNQVIKDFFGSNGIICIMRSYRFIGECTSMQSGVDNYLNFNAWGESNNHKICGDVEKGKECITKPMEAFISKKTEAESAICTQTAVNIVKKALDTVISLLPCRDSPTTTTTTTTATPTDAPHRGRNGAEKSLLWSYYTMILILFLTSYFI